MAKLRVDKIAAPIVKDEFTGSVYFDGTGDYLSLPIILVIFNLELEILPLNVLHMQQNNKLMIF